MGNFTDIQIRACIKNNEHFEAKADGNGLYLRFPERYKKTTWRFRFRLGGKRIPYDFGSYGEISLKKARKMVEKFNAKVTLGINPKEERRKNEAEAVKVIEAQKNTTTAVFLKYFETPAIQKQKHLIKRRYIRDIEPVIGGIPAKQVEPHHVDEILQRVLRRNAPKVANKVLRLGVKIFDFALKRKLIRYNIFAAFDTSDAGGKEKPRDRWLTREELAQMFEVFETAKGMPFENIIAIKLLLMLAVRKMELIAARKDEFDLDAAIWHLPAERTKTEKALAIPLSHQAVSLLKKLFILSGQSDYLFPARKSQTRLLPTAYFCGHT